MTFEADPGVIEALLDFPLCHTEMIWLVKVEAHALVVMEARLGVMEMEAQQSFPLCHMRIVLFVVVVVETKAPDLRHRYPCSLPIIPLYVEVLQLALSRIPGVYSLGTIDLMPSNQNRLTRFNSKTGG